MTLGLEGYVSERLHQMGVVGWSPQMVVDIAMCAAIEALDTCDVMCEALGDGSIHDVSHDSHDRTRWPNATDGPFRSTTLDLLIPDDRYPDSAGAHFAWIDWLRGRFRAVGDH